MCAMLISPGCGVVPPPTNPASLAEWCRGNAAGARITSTHGNDASDVINGIAPWSALANRSSAVSNSHRSRSARTTYKQSFSITGLADEVDRQVHIANPLPHFLPHPFHALCSLAHCLRIADSFENAVDSRLQLRIDVDCRWFFGRSHGLLLHRHSID
jgi:hypothetical protein